MGTQAQPGMSTARAETNGDKSGDRQTPAEQHKQTALVNTRPAHL